jgi:phage internal scaffolding protein
MSIQLSNRPKLSSAVHGQFSHAYSKSKSQALTFLPENSLTRQEFKDECDINHIMARYQSTGELPRLNQGTAQFLDVSASLQFQDSMNFIAEAQSMFNELPSRIRDRFYNDPAQFLDFCSNPKNTVELASMGLLTPEATHAALNPSTPSSPTPTPPKSSTKAPEPDSKTD